MFVGENKDNEKTSMFGSYFFKLFLKTVFKNIVNLVLILSENRSYSLNLMFFIFFIFFRTKKLITKYILRVFLIFFV